MSLPDRHMTFWIRTAVQWCFLLWVVGIGIRFGMFVNAVEIGAAAPMVSRPPGVEGFLPIGALTSLKYWLVSGTIHPVHPAALVIFLAVLLMSLLVSLMLSVIYYVIQMVSGLLLPWKLEGIE